MKSFEIGILELGFRKELDSISAIKEIIDYAIKAEDYGFAKFWLAEHHYIHFNSHSYTNPEILISLIAGMTNEIEVGSAGTSICSYSPYSVVTNYKLLNNLFHNRITLGLSKGLPESSHVIDLINKDLHYGSGYIFDKNLSEIYNLLYNEKSNYKDKSILIPPYGGSIPQMWYLSTSLKYTSVSIEFKTNYCISLFHCKTLVLNQINLSEQEIKEYRNFFYLQNGFFPQISIALAINFIKEVDKKEDLDWNKKMIIKDNSFLIISCTHNELYQLFEKIRRDFGINQFVIYDVTPTNKEKIENLIGIKEIFNL